MKAREKTMDKIAQKMNTWQTVYEQLQEIQEAILNKIYPDLSISEAIYKYWCINEVKYSDEFGGVCVFSLSRVLSALGTDWLFDSVWMFHIWNPTHTVFDWKILNEDNSDAMLSDQSDETIQSIYKILCK